MKYKNIDMNSFSSFKRGGDEGKEEYLYGLIDFCLDNVDENDTVLELGCFHGASTSVFSHFANKVITVDLDFSRIPQDFTEKHKNVELIKRSSLNVSDLEINYDLLYIDTVHEYNHCIAELKSLVGLCKSSPKKIGGHDYHMEGIKKAVNDFFGEEPKNTYQDYSWYYELNE
jgi:hypothetical protein